MHKIERSKFMSYAFTYKKNVIKTQVLTVDDYTDVLLHIKKFGSITSLYYENSGKENKLHIHGVALLPCKIRYKTLTVKGYTSQWKEIYSLTGWLDYIQKDVDIRECVYNTCNDAYYHEMSEYEQEHFDTYKMPTKSLFK